MIKQTTTIQKKELIRKLTHIVFGLILIALIQIEKFNLIVMISIIIISLTVSLLLKNQKLPQLHKILSKYERGYDLEHFPGKGFITFLIGATITYTLFPKNVTIAALVILTIGDSTAHIIGRYYGKINITNNNKNIEGTFVAIFLCMLINFFLIHYLISFISASLSMIIELFEVKVGKILFDDNLYLPIIAGSIIFILEKLI